MNGTLFEQHVGVVAQSTTEWFDVLVLFVNVQLHFVLGGKGLGAAGALVVFVFLMQGLHVVKQGLFILQDLSAQFALLLHSLVPM